MRNYSKVAAAVAVAIGSGSALAAGPTWTVSLNVAGSSAFRDAFAGELSTTLCNADYTAYVATAGTVAGQQPSPDFRAYTCTLKAAIAASGSLPAIPAGTGIIVYYRSEGGSIFGVLGNAAINGGTAQAFNSLNIGTSGAVNAGPYVVNETAAQLLGDTQTGAVQKQVVQLGISDVNPAAFVGSNYGSEYTFAPPPPSSAQLLAVPVQAKSIVGQVFAPIVNVTSNTSLSGFNTNNGTGLSSKGLTSTEIATIISGNVSDWSLVPSAAAAGATAPAPITICRRDAGSGTQVLTSNHFLGSTCSSGGLPFIAASVPGVTVVTNYSTSTVLSCVKGTPGAIGFVAVQPATTKYVPNNAVQIMVDGVQGTALNAASNQYSYYAEAYAVKDTALTGQSASLANAIVTDLLHVGKLPTTAADPNLVAVPNSFNTPVSPVVSNTQPPIGIITTNGNVCTPAVDVL